MLTQDSLVQKTATLFGRASGVLDPVRFQAWEKLGISFPQLRILFKVKVNPGMGVRSLSEAMDISPSAVSQQVEKLVVRGLLRRSDNPDDRRHVVLELTGEGLQATGEISRASHELVEPLLSILPEEDLVELHRLLTRITEEAVKRHTVELAAKN